MLPALGGHRLSLLIWGWAAKMDFMQQFLDALWSEHEKGTLEIGPGVPRAMSLLGQDQIEVAPGEVWVRPDGDDTWFLLA